MLGYQTVRLDKYINCYIKNIKNFKRISLHVFKNVDG